MSNSNKRVSETSAGKSIKAVAILKGGKLIATVLAHYGNSGNVLVNVTQFGSAARKSLPVAQKANPKLKVEYPGDGLTFQGATAGGYGYDKLTAALSGMVIDGIALNNHCGVRLPLPEGKKLFPRDFKAPKGYRLANFVSERSLPSQYEGEEGYMDCYRTSGLDLLTDLGYQVESLI